MAASFSMEEKRFVLAEMIKCSTVDIERLARFVESNVLDPKWMTMQIPTGRNLEQCLQVANLLSTAPGHRYVMSQNDHLISNGMNHARQIAPRTSPSGQTPGALPPSPGVMSPWQLAEGVEDRRPVPYEAPKKRGRPSRADRKTAAPARLATIAPKPAQPTPGSNTPRTILPAAQRQDDAPNSQPVHTRSPSDTSPGKKRRRTATGAVSVSASPPTPAQGPYLPPAVTTPPSSVDHGHRPRTPIETDSTPVRDSGQVKHPRPVPLEPEPRHHPLMSAGSAAPPSQIKA